MLAIELRPKTNETSTILWLSASWIFINTSKSTDILTFFFFFEILEILDILEILEI